jgi:acetylornithine deacetylase/succinyl-diaminopimelate desuccinylase-like protein
MSDHREAALAFARGQKDAFLKSLKELISLPSISTDPVHAADMQKTAEWVSNRLRGLGVNNVQIFQTEKHPVVYGEWLEAKNNPTVLIYGHYDVQPVDPLELWLSPPFEATQRGDNLFARGASDMKGQLAATFSAIESIVRTGPFPLNMKFMIEGEEEIGSPSLDKFIVDHRDLLKCDFALNPDSGIMGPDWPSITYGLRGLAYFEIRIYGPSGDLHSGMFGGAVHNPAIVLAELLAGMHDKDGRIMLPGFYDKVRPLTKEERTEFSRLPTDDAYYQKVTGVPALFGEAGYSAPERIGGRPSLDVNGLLSGFTGAGSKTVLPAYAMAKVSTRLVPDQDPAVVEKQLRRYLETHAPKTVRWELVTMAGGPASISPLDTLPVRALAKALEQVWGKKPLFKREWGSVPVVGQMQKYLGVESVMAGFGLPDDNLHAPNEKQHLPTWYRGIEAYINFFFNLEK